MYSLCHFTFFLFLDGKFGIKTLQKRISGKVSFHGEMEGEDAKDDSLYSILEVLWQDAEQIKSYQEKQNRYYNRKHKRSRYLH